MALIQLINSSQSSLISTSDAKGLQSTCGLVVGNTSSPAKAGKGQGDVLPNSAVGRGPTDGTCSMSGAELYLLTNSQQ